MAIIVYYISKPDPEAFFPNLREPCAEAFGQTELLAALKRVEELRKQGMTHVCISTELDDSIGGPGVDAVVDGKTPDGQPYTWMKRRSS